MMKIAFLSLGLFVGSDAIEDKPKKTFRQQITAQAHHLNMGGVAAVAGAAIGAGATFGNFAGALGTLSTDTNGAGGKPGPAAQSATTQAMVDQVLQGNKAKLLGVQGAKTSRMMRLERDITLSGNVTSSAQCESNEYYWTVWSQNTKTAPWAPEHGSCGSLITGLTNAHSATTTLSAVSAGTVSAATVSAGTAAVSFNLTAAVSVNLAYFQEGDEAVAVEVSDIAISVGAGAAAIAVGSTIMGVATALIAADGDISSGSASTFGSDFSYDLATREMQVGYSFYMATSALDMTVTGWETAAIATCIEKQYADTEGACETYVDNFKEFLPAALGANYLPESVSSKLSGETRAQLTACLLESGGSNYYAGSICTCELADVANLNMDAACIINRSDVYSFAAACIADPSSPGCKSHGDGDPHGQEGDDM